MKKQKGLAILLIIGFCLTLVSSPLKTAAGYSSAQPSVAQGSWNLGSELDVTKSAANAPFWLQLLTKGVVLNEAGKICHPFRGGQFGWVGQIRQFKNGEWILLPTTNDWVPNKEGKFMSCAQTTEAGTYALFGYYLQPAAPKTGSVCDSISWTTFAGADGTIIFDGIVEGVPEGTTITIEVVGSTPPGTTGSTSDATNADGEYFVNADIGADGLEDITVTYTESSHGCSITRTHTFIGGF